MRPLVLLHGFLGERADFDALTAMLQPHRCVALDLPGHGASPAPAASATFLEGTAQLAAEIRRQKVAPCHLFGYSLGGRVALALACTNPELLVSVAALGAHPGIASPTERSQRLAEDHALAAQLERAGLAGFLEQWYAHEMFAPLRQHPCFAAVQQRRQRGRAAALAAALRMFSVGAQPPLEPALVAAQLPVLLLAGALDLKYEASNRRLVTRITRATCRTIADAGHSAHLENAPALAACWLEFIRGVDCT